VEISGEEHPVSAPAKMALFRIVQEALNNAIKHARATKVNIYLHYLDDSVNIQVSDNGQGFNQRSLSSGGRVSWGLRNMQERAKLLGGTFQVRSGPGEGTTIDVFIPYVATDEVSDDNPSASGG
jgi:signal transduction histidine kinase